MFIDAKEKRQHIRLNLRIPMRYKKLETQGEEFKGSLVQDISAGGARMNIHEFLPLNSRLSLEIPMGSARKAIGGTARVIWTNRSGLGDQYNTGLEFLHLNQGDHARIANFIFAKGRI